jgi:hypothetical protein
VSVCEAPRSNPWKVDTVETDSVSILHSEDVSLKRHRHLKAPTKTSHFHQRGKSCMRLVSARLLEKINNIFICLNHRQNVRRRTRSMPSVLRGARRHRQELPPVSMRVPDMRLVLAPTYAHTFRSIPTRFDITLLPACLCVE